MKKKLGQPRKVLSASERKAVVTMLRNTKNITATVNNLRAIGLDISKFRVRSVARDEKLEFKVGAPPARFTAQERKEVLEYYARPTISPPPWPRWLIGACALLHTQLAELHGMQG